MSLIEAVSYGIPAIATNVGGTSEVIADKMNGLLIRPNFSDSELVDAIRYFLNLPINEYRIYQENSYDRWKNLFDSEKNYEEFFSKILQD